MAAHQQLTVDTPDELTKDTVFSVLSNQRRRHVLRCLREQPNGSNIRDLSQQIAAWENDITIGEITYKQRKRVYTSLHQTHLPKLDDVGVIEYDRDRGTVALTDRAATLDGYLVDETAEREVPWPGIYLAIAVFGSTLLGLRWLEIAVFASVPELAVGGVIVAAVAATAAVHGVYVRGLSPVDRDDDGQRVQ